MFRAYGSLPPSECSSPAAVLSSECPFGALQDDPLAGWTGPIGSPAASTLGRSISMFDGTTMSSTNYTGEAGPRQWPIGFGHGTGGGGGGGSRSNGIGNYDEDPVDATGLSNLLASAKFFKSDSHQQQHHHHHRRQQPSKGVCE